MKTYKKLVIGLLVLAMIGASIVAGIGTGTPAQAQSSTVPILVVVNSAATNKFGAYLGEMLRAEGLNAYDVKELSALTAGDLSSHDVTILPSTPLTTAQATLFTNHVAGGGRLIAMRPDITPCRCGR